MPNYREPAKMPSKEVQEYIMNPGKWISDLKDEIKELKAEIKRKNEAIHYTLKMDSKEGYGLHPESVRRLLKALNRGGK